MTQNQSYKKAFSLLTSLFFMWGFITVMNDVLINTFKSIFDLTAPQRSFIQLAFFGAFFVVSLIYFLVSSISGKDPINKIGYKNGMMISLLICGIGCLAFYPAAQMESYNAFLTALFILATGVTCLQICANPYATILGPSESSSSRLNLAQGFNSLGTTIGPLIGVILIYKIFSTGELTVESVGKTYLFYGSAFILIALFVRFSKMPSFTNDEKIESGMAVFKQRHLVLGVFAIFFYVGSEVSIGSWVVEFIKQDEIKGLNEADASYFLSYFWGGLMIGRLMASISLSKTLTDQKKLIYMPLIGLAVFFFIYLVTSIKVDNGAVTMVFLSFQQIALYLVCLVIIYVAFILAKGNAARSLVIFSTINFILIGIAMITEGDLAFWAIIATGLFFSVGWSNVFSLAIKDLGKLTSQGSSLLVMAIVGGAILPYFQSQIIEAKGVQMSFIIPLIGVLYLIFYGLEGYKIKSNK
jgi:FHS family L-fucose permease-like MFS transporter